MPHLGARLLLLRLLLLPLGGGAYDCCLWAFTSRTAPEIAVATKASIAAFQQGSIAKDDGAWEESSGSGDPGSGVPSPPPPPPPPPPPNDNEKVAAEVFAIIIGLIGLVLVFKGHMFFRLFIGLMTCVIVTGGVGVLLFDTSKSMAWWACPLISVTFGILTGVIASYAVTLGLVLCATISGGVIAALPVRLIAPEMPGSLRLTIIIVTAAVCAAATIAVLHRFRIPIDDDEDDAGRPLSEGQWRSLKRRARTMRDVLTALVTTIMGAFFVVHAVNQWWHDGDADDESALQFPSLLNPAQTLPPCLDPPNTACIGLEILDAALLIIGLAVQFSSFCRKPRRASSSTELQSTGSGHHFAALQEPLEPSAPTSLTQPPPQGAGSPLLTQPLVLNEVQRAQAAEVQAEELGLQFRSAQAELRAARVAAAMAAERAAAEARAAAESAAAEAAAAQRLAEDAARRAGEAFVEFGPPDSEIPAEAQPESMVAAMEEARPASVTAEATEVIQPPGWRIRGEATEDAVRGPPPPRAPQWRDTLLD